MEMGMARNRIQFQKGLSEALGAEHTSPQTQGKACGNRFTRGAFGRAGHELAGILMARSDFADTSSNASIARRKLALDWCADEAIRDKRLRFAALRPTLRVVDLAEAIARPALRPW